MATERIKEVKFPLFLQNTELNPNLGFRDHVAFPPKHFSHATGYSLIWKAQIKNQLWTWNFRLSSVAAEGGAEPYLACDPWICVYVRTFSGETFKVLPWWKGHCFVRRRSGRLQKHDKLNRWVKSMMLFWWSSRREKWGEVAVLQSNRDLSSTGKPLVKYHVKTCAGIIWLYIERTVWLFQAVPLGL